MNRPDFLQYLTKGKILSSKIFPKFVDTWNWLVSAFDSFVGDANLNPVEGFITVDRTDPSRPILRLTNTDKLGGGEVTITGTDGNAVTGSSIVFASEEDSNVTVKATKDEETGVITVKIGVYWKR